VRESRLGLKTGSHPLNARSATCGKAADSTGAGSRASQQQVAGLLGIVQPVFELSSVVFPARSAGQQQAFGVPAAEDTDSSANARHQPPGNASDKMVAQRISALIRYMVNPARQVVQ